MIDAEEGGMSSIGAFGFNSTLFSLAHWKTRLADLDPLLHECELGCEA